MTNVVSGENAHFGFWISNFTLFVIEVGDDNLPTSGTSFGSRRKSPRRDRGQTSDRGFATLQKVSEG
jgi:hypothetical protein